MAETEKDEPIDESKGAAPYIPFTTFLSALDAVAANSVPNVIDRHSFPSSSGSTVNGILSAFRFFGLIDHSGTPLAALRTLAMEKNERKVNIKLMLEKYYSTVFALNLAGATPPQLDQVFSTKTYNVNGDTKKKAKTFFLKAAQYAEIPVSKLLLKKSRASSPRKAGAKKTAAKKADGGGASGGTSKPATGGENTPTQGESRTITLENGGTLTLSLNVNILSLKGADRNFVFKLIDEIEAYENSPEGKS
jgi:hypothetical protein